MESLRQRDLQSTWGAPETADCVEFDFSMDRRTFVQVLGAGLLVSVGAGAALAQSRGQSSAPKPISTRVHVGKDGTVTVLCGKIEMGQGARTELAQAAAEELRVPFERVKMVLGDTGLVPDDGLSAGSRTTPYTLPAVRRGAAAARQVLSQMAARKWNLDDPSTLRVEDGVIRDPASGRTITYSELAANEEALEAFKTQIPEDVQVTPVDRWRIMGVSVQRGNRRDMVTGAHKHPSDYRREGMLYGKVLRAPGPGLTLSSVDVSPARAMKDVVAVRDGSFVGVAAPTSFLAQRAIQAVAETAKWESASHPSSREIYDYLRSNAQGGVPENGFKEELEAAAKKLSGTYHVAYVQHAPMETRTALAEWAEGKLTVWTGTQNPFGYHGDLARTFRLRSEDVRVIVPDFGCGFGGKHSAEAAIEAARLAQEARRPVLVRWTREEEFTWAYFRPAAVIDCEASLDASGKVTSWHFINVNAGGAAIDTPYNVSKRRCRAVGSKSPLRQGSYRALAAVANNFARECFMDELAFAASMDPLEFRLANLETPRLRAVLEEAARRFDWKPRVACKDQGIGVGLACGTEKGSYVAACVEVAVDPQQERISVKRVTQVFECGAIVNPHNLMAQVQGCLIMGLGPALKERMRFANGRLANAAFSRYQVPRFADVPDLDIHLLNRPDLPSVGGGETPIIAIAPAIANAVYHATGRRVREMPITLGAAKEG